MIRVVVAVLLAAGLLAVSLPALDTARSDRATARIDRFGHRIAVAAAELADSEAPVRPGVAGARRSVGVERPPESVTVAPITSLLVRCHPAGDIELGFNVDGQPKSVRVPVPAPVAIEGHGRITPTDHPELRLTFHRLTAGPTVVVHSTATRSSETDSTRPEDSTAGTGPPTPCSVSTSQDSTRQPASGPAPVPPRSKPPP